MSEYRTGPCESCTDPQVVLSQYGISLAALDLDGRFCSSCLYEEMDARGLISHIHEGEKI